MTQAHNRRRKVMKAGAAAVDALLSPLAVLSLPAVGFAARVGWHAPILRRIYELANASVLRHHYYTPVVFPADLDKPLDAPRDLPGIDMREEAQAALLRQLTYGDEIPNGPLKSFDYDNPNFAHDDAYVLYSLLRHLKPRRVLEIGSGYSTLVIQAALEANGTAAKQTCIEPFEMPWLEKTGIEIVRERVERMDMSRFLELEDGDVLFIDSSHVIRPQGDVVHEYLSILPRLKPGVIVHVHDVYTPYDYHPYLVVKERKLWDEQYLMEALLSGGDRFEVMLANYWICRQQPEAFAVAVPGFSLPPQRDGCSFWMRRTG